MENYSVYIILSTHKHTHTYQIYVHIQKKHTQSGASLLLGWLWYRSGLIVA